MKAILDELSLDSRFFGASLLPIGLLLGILSALIG